MKFIYVKPEQVILQIIIYMNLLDYGPKEINEIFYINAIKNEDQIKLDNVVINNIYRHSLLFGWTMYELLEDHYRILGYGILITDFMSLFDKYFTKSSIRKNILYYKDDENEYEIIRIDVNLINLIKSTEHKNYGNIPVAQMIIFNHDNDFIETFIKRPEIYLISKIAIELADYCRIELQSNILDYRIDCLFSITSLKCDNIDKIALEIDENDHITYDTKKDKFREEVLKAFKNKVIQVPVRRKSNRKELDEIVSNKVIEIKLLIDDLIAQYSLDSISHDEFIKLLQNEMTIDINFAKMFAKKNHSVLDNFKYEHSEIANFLGYVCDDNRYKRFIELIKKNLINDINYIMVIEDDKKVDSTVHLLSDRQKVGRGQKIKYYLNRLGFYLICMSANTMKAKEYKMQFGKVYEIALKYVQGLKQKIIESQISTETMNQVVTKRLNDKIDDKLARKRESKIEILYNKQLEEIDSLKLLLVEKDNEITHLKIVTKDLYDKVTIKNNESYIKKNKKSLSVKESNILIIKQILHYDRIIQKQLDDFYKVYDKVTIKNNESYIKKNKKSLSVKESNILIIKQILHYDRIIQKQLDDFYKVYSRLLSINI